MMRSTASGVLPAAESAMIVTGLVGYCWACAEAAAIMTSSGSHAVLRRGQINCIVIRLPKHQPTPLGNSALANEGAGADVAAPFTLSMQALGRAEADSGVPRFGIFYCGASLLKERAVSERSAN